MVNRQILLFILFIAVGLTSWAQGGQWEWVNGSNTPNAPAAYGVKGTPSIYNTPEGVAGAAFWPDLQGNFWIMGGFDASLSVPCALWRYSPATNQWTWMSGNDGIQRQDEVGPGIAVYGTRGVAAETNYPGARVWSTQWTDNNGNLWLYGGSGWDSTGYPEVYADLWEYNIATNLWTWVNGSTQPDAPCIYSSYQIPNDSATPGNRYGAGSAWVDANNNLWFFGGVPWDTSAAVASYNDMWRYNISTNQWTWMNGPQGMGDPGYYGTKGVENAGNRPPHRTSNTRWKDADGNFYLWGGGDFWNGQYQYDDVWKYDVTTNHWVWIAGHDTNYFQGVYTQYCTDTGNSGPGARTFNTTAQVLGATNIFYAYAGYDHTGGYPGLDDLWVFNNNTNQWKWIGGQPGLNVSANYGTEGVASASNLPGGRYESCLWVDSAGNMWMFGGEQVTNTYNLFNDMWKFIPNAPGYQLSGNIGCGGGEVALSLTGLSNASITPSASVTWQDSVAAFLAPATTTTYVVTGQATCPVNVQDSFTFTVQVGGSITAEIEAAPLVFCPDDSSIICTTSPFASYNWSNGDTGMCIVAKNAGDYYVTVTNAQGCMGVSNHVSVAAYPAISISISESGDTLSAYGAKQLYQWEYDGQAIPGDTASYIIATEAGNYIVEITDSNGCSNASNPIAVSGIEDPGYVNNLLVYPNPLYGKSWHVQAGAEWLGAQLKIFDINGQVVYTAQVSSTAFDIPMQVASAGVYVLQIENDTRSGCMKLIKL